MLMENYLCSITFKMAAKGIVPRSLPLPTPAMALSCLSRPISPSPTPTELRDDVGALYSEFKKRATTAFRRRLSTSFDIPPGIPSQGGHDKKGKKKEKEEPDELQKEIILERFLKSNVPDVDVTLEEDENQKDSSPPTSPVHASGDLFSLLEKVINYRGRSVSQISVEVRHQLKQNAQ